MRVELLFLRWLLVIALVAFTIAYVWSARESEPAVRYDVVPLIEGGRSAGMPLAGIIVDPVRRDVSAVIGGPDGEDRFFIVWRAVTGDTYGTAFLDGASENVLYKISVDGEAETVLGLPEKTAADPEAAKAMHALLEALPK